MNADEMNAAALAANLADLRDAYGERLQSLENEIASMKVLVHKQSTFIGQAMQGLMGSGSTVKE